MTINGNAERGTDILNNELYIGRLVWNRLRYVKDPEIGKRMSRLNAEAEWIVQAVRDLRIVEDTLWDRIKARQRTCRPDRRPRDGTPAFWDRRRPHYLFSGLIRCGVCGGGFSMIGRTGLGCSTVFATG